MSMDKHPRILTCQMEAIVYILPSFKIMCNEKDFKENEHTNLHLAQNYARISVLVHFHVLEVTMFECFNLLFLCS